MPAQQPLALAQFTEPNGRKRKEYYQYAEAVLAEMCWDDVRDLMEYFDCGLDRLIDSVVTHKLGTLKGDKWRR